MVHLHRKRKRRKDVEISQAAPRASSDTESILSQNSCCSKHWHEIKDLAELNTYFASKIEGGVDISQYQKSNAGSYLTITYRCRIPRDKASLLISVQLPLAHAKEGIFINKLKQKLDNHFDQQRAREIEAERQAQIEAQNARLHVRNMNQAPRPKLSLQAKRWRTIIVTLPIMGATSFVLYQRLVQGKPQRTISKPPSTTEDREQGSSSEKYL